MTTHTRLTARTALGRAVLGALAAALAFIAAPALADVKAGVDAWSAGDYDSAVAEWRGPAANGDPDALFNLAQAYRLGRGVEGDLARARDLYAEAARKGHVKAADNYGLLLFQQGDQDSAMPLIRDAADRGDPRAQYVLGLAHFNADYAQKDWVRAYALLTLARSQGLPQATDALAQMDRYVPEQQKQEAQLLARTLEAESARRRAARLAAADLGAGAPSGSSPAPRGASAPAVMTDAGTDPKPAREPGPAPVLVAAAQSPPAPQRATEPVPARRAPARIAQAGTTRPARVETAARPRGEWRVQLGAFGVPGNAERLWSKMSSNPALAGTDRALVPAGRVTKLQAVGFASRSEAQAACSALKREGQACIVAAPRS
ncbi:MAG: SPOR domain-containing protein [Erythrobacter sp.]|uniref:SPOR domain-containing protein n=1 Tax=Erythrobacter sp. TaxID=1042 RepID=UPI0032EE1D9E